MKTNATEHKTNGRKTANAALITLFRVGVIASMLVLGAGMAAGATWTVNDGGGTDFTTIPVAMDAASGADEIEISYDDGSAEGGWSMGYNPMKCTPDSDGGKNGYALRMTTPNSEPFTISAIKVFSMRYGEDCKTRFEIWDHDKNTLYSDIVPHSEYSILGPWDCDVWDYATWGYKDVPDVTVSGDFYIVMYTDSTNPGDDIYPDTGVYVCYDRSYSSDRAYVVWDNVLGWGEKTLTWDLSTPQETTNWMIRVVGTGGAPPELEITSHENGDTVYTSTITVTGTASDPSGIASVTVNGALASGAADWSTWSTEVALDVGDNTITVVATNNSGGSRTELVDVTYTSEPIYNGDFEIIDPLDSSNPDGWTLEVGGRNYQGNSLYKNVESDYYYSGSHSIKFGLDGYSSECAYGIIKSPLITTVQGKLYWHQYQYTTADSSDIEYTIEFYDEDDNLVSSSLYYTDTTTSNWDYNDDNYRGPDNDMSPPAVIVAGGGPTSGGGSWYEFCEDIPNIGTDEFYFEISIYQWEAPNKAGDGDIWGSLYYGGFDNFYLSTPPFLTIITPTTGTTTHTHTPTITVAGTASDPSGIASVTVNGVLASGALDWSTWSAEIALALGENTIPVVATNTTGGSTTKAINVTYVPLLDGKVLSSGTNDGIEKVTVTLTGTGKTNKTGTNGYYSFSGVADGSYTLTASKPGYTFSPVDVVVSESTRASPIIGTIDTTVINAEITSTVMPSGSFRPGDSVEVTITVKNTGIIEHTFYVGYSVRDPEDTFWDAPYVPVTLSPDESATETLRWTVQPGAPVGSYDVYTAAWATQHWSYLYDNLDRENAYEIFSVQANPGFVPGWTFNNDMKYKVLVNGEKYTAVWAMNDSNGNRSWMIYDTDGKVPDLTTFQHAAKTATVSDILGSDTADEVESLRSMQENMNKFTDLTVLGKFALWVRDTGAYLLGKIVVASASGGTSLTTEMPASAALKVAKEEIAKELSEKIIGDIEGIITGETSMKELLAKNAIEEIEQSASELGIAANVLETHGGGLWTYDEANSYYDNYKSGAINGITYINLSYELQPGSDFASQMFGVCKEAMEGGTGGIVDLDKLIDGVEDVEAVTSSAIVRKKHENTFAVTDARFGIDARKLWNAYQDTNKIGGTLMCPGSLHAYDSEGSHVGMNSAGNIDLEIPNSYYSGPDAEPEIIRIYTLQDYNITFYVDNATGTGTFNLTLERQVNRTHESVCYLDIFINETTVVSVSTNNSSNPEHIMEIDYDGDDVTDNTTEPTHILINYAPNVSITTPTEDQSGNVTISYNLKDAESDNCTIMAQYSLDNITWLGAGAGEGGDAIINITSAPAGVDHTFMWASSTDLPQTNATVYFRIRPYDGDLAGDYAATDAFSVDNRVRGDLNGDNQITPADAAIALAIAAGNRPFDDAADVSGDRKVTSLDALMILQAAAGVISL